MRFKYDPESDILLIGISDDPPVDALEEPGGVIISYGKQGNPVTIEFRNATVKNLIKQGEVNISFQTSNYSTIASI